MARARAAKPGGRSGGGGRVARAPAVPNGGEAAGLAFATTCSHTMKTCLCILAAFVAHASAAEPPRDIFARENLVAWCIVPFDAKKRGPEERAAMLEKIGIRRLAYDYRAEHIPSFDAELDALQRHGIELTAWWFPTVLNDEAKLILDVI